MFWITWRGLPSKSLDNAEWVIHLIPCWMIMIAIHTVVPSKDFCEHHIFTPPWIVLFLFFNRSSLSGGPLGFLANEFIFPYTAKFNFPRLKSLMVECLPFRRTRELKSIADIMYETSFQIIEEKKKAMNSEDPDVVAEMTNKKDVISTLSVSPINHIEVFVRISSI